MSSIRRLCSRLERSLLSCSSWISHDVCDGCVWACLVWSYIYHLFKLGHERRSFNCFLSSGFFFSFSFLFLFYSFKSFWMWISSKDKWKKLWCKSPKNLMKQPAHENRFTASSTCFSFLFFFHSSHFPFPRAQPCLWGWRGGCTRIYRCSVFGIWVKGQHAGQRWERPFWEIE